MRARVRTDDGEYSEWFDVTEGLRQAFVVASAFQPIFSRRDTRRAILEWGFRHPKGEGGQRYRYRCQRKQEAIGRSCGTNPVQIIGTCALAVQYSKTNCFVLCNKLFF